MGKRSCISPIDRTYFWYPRNDWSSSFEIINGMKFHYVPMVARESLSHKNATANWHWRILHQFGCFKPFPIPFKMSNLLRLGNHMLDGKTKEDISILWNASPWHFRPKARDIVLKEEKEWNRTPKLIFRDTQRVWENLGITLSLDDEDEAKCNFCWSNQ